MLVVAFNHLESACSGTVLVPNYDHFLCSVELCRFLL